jgi:hypothetical protein
MVSQQDAYRGVVRVLLAASILGMLLTAVGGWVLGNPVVLDAAVALRLETGVLVGLTRAQRDRANPPEIVARAQPQEVAPAVEGLPALETRVHTTA